MRHANISIFVPHLGCPNNCSFCNQRHITGQAYIPTSSDVINAVETARTSLNFDSSVTEIAFFGGSFTAIDRDYMVSLLSAAKPYVEKGIVKGIRISTRPDCINDEILSLLADFSVTAIELGAQSMNDSVLISNNRGHSERDVITASKLIKNYGFELGLQMMTGLYQSNDILDTKSAHMLAELKPDTVRIYPTIVLKHTALAELYYSNKYLPQTLENAVKLCAKLKMFFYEKNIKVIRLGLHTIEEDAFVAGPWHPAFSELCDSEIYKTILENKFQKQGTYKVFVNKSEVSKTLGHKRKNAEYFHNRGIDFSVNEDNSLNKYDVRIEEVK